MKWLGHRDLCPIQWGEACDCEDSPQTAEATPADQSAQGTEAGDSRHWSDGTPVDDAEMEANSRD